jgi:hypothetical protein
MIRPEPLTKNEPLLWSTGTGANVWDLFCACIAGDLETVRRLVDTDPSLVRSHYEYRTPLSFAVRENQLDVAAFLLDHGADPLGVGGDLVEVASDRGYVEMERLLKGRFRAYTARRRKANPSRRRFAPATWNECGNCSTKRRSCCTPGMSDRTSRFTGLS